MNYSLQKQVSQQNNSHNARRCSTFLISQNYIRATFITFKIIYRAKNNFFNKFSLGLVDGEREKVV